MFQCAIFSGVVCLAVACGDDMISTRNDSDAPPELVEVDPPQIRAVAPSTLHAGEMMTVLGSGFLPEAEIELHMEGVFEHESGAQDEVSFVVPARYVSAGRLEWAFEPDLPPAGFGHELGTFRGTVTTEMSAPQMLIDPSDPTPVEIAVEPSLVVWRARTPNSECGQRIATTIPMPPPRAGELPADFDITNFDVPLPLGAAPAAVIDVEAIGFGTGSVVAPLEISAVYVNLADEPVVESRTITTGRAARFELDPGTITVFDRDLSGYDVFPMPVTFRVETVDGQRLDRKLELVYAWDTFVRYDGNVVLRELYPPVQVSGCLAGGSLGRNVSYNTGQNESRGRSLSTSFNFDVAIPGGAFIFDMGFGFNVSESVSSAQSEGLSISGRVLPNQYGVFYRQTQRLERTGNIFKRDACGEPFEVGQAFVTDWNWAPDLAFTTNSACPPAPPSNLPPAQVFE